MGRDRNLLAEILEMDRNELLAYVEQKSLEEGIEFDPDMLDDDGIEGLYDFIADNLHPEFQAELHSECQLEPGCGMFPNSENAEDLEEELEHFM
ncbi:MAG: hypothetical protein PHW24_01610 [Candidatus Moranbacteria bacterium]|nr:hypothetical protein [Candidatus Moranbacteria bacterium]